MKNNNDFRPKIMYKILKIDPTNHSILVRYYTDKFTEDNLAISINNDGSIIRTDDGSPERCSTDYSITIWQTNPPPTEKDIIELIEKSAPHNMFKLKNDILDDNVDTTLSSIKNLLGKQFEISEKSIETREIKQISEEEVDKLLAELSR